MANADFLVTWPGLSSSPSTTPPWTLSHRRSSGEVMPTVASTSNATGTSSFFTFLPALSTSDPTSAFTAVSYIRLLTMPSNYPTTATANAITRGPTSFIYASSTVAPTGKAEDAVLTQHNQAHSTTSLDLSTPIALASSNQTDLGAPVATPDAAAGRTTRDKYLIAHGLRRGKAVIGTLGVLFFSPIAILIARYFRGSTWFPAHAAFNILAAILIVTAFGIGYVQTGFPHFQDTHTQVGLSLLVLVLVQVVFGALAHRTKSEANPDARFPTLSGKSPIRLGHMLMGLAILGLGLAQVYLGMEEYPANSDGMETVARGVFIVYYVLVAIISVMYIGGWVKEFFGGNRGASSDNEKSRLRAGGDSPL
ncbi:hypothetical protein P7C70_g1329, partial [Phenoliferia sp. Uapishka_3]